MYNDIRGQFMNAFHMENTCSDSWETSILDLKVRVCCKQSRNHQGIHSDGYLTWNSSHVWIPGVACPQEKMKFRFKQDS